MTRKMSAVFWIECMGALSTLLLTISTAIWPNWIELLFEAELDGGDGSLEWLIVFVLFVATVVLSFLARSEWRRTCGRSGVD